VCAPSPGASGFVNTSLDSTGPAAFDLFAECVGKGLGRQARFDRVPVEMKVGMELDEGLASFSPEDVEAYRSQSSAADCDGIGRDVR
jgi:hypothetical protein